VVLEADRGREGLICRFLEDILFPKGNWVKDTFHFSYLLSSHSNHIHFVNVLGNEVWNKLSLVFTRGSHSRRLNYLSGSFDDGLPVISLC
jgi:hypothetical protein